MAAELKIELKDQAILDKINKMSDKSRILKFFRVLAATIGFKEVIKHFREKRGPDGPWPERSPSTLKRYQEIHTGKRAPPPGTSKGMFSPGKPLLVLTGQLSRQFLPSNVEKSEANVTIFNPVEYSKMHDEGGDPTGARRAGFIPQRKFMWISQNGMDLIADGLSKKILSEEP